MADAVALGPLLHQPNIESVGDDLRVYAHLRRPGAARSTRRTSTAGSPCGRRDGADIPVGSPKECCRQHGKGARGRRARTARAPAASGWPTEMVHIVRRSGRRAPRINRPGIPAPDLFSGRCRRPDAARAHRGRYAAQESHQRGAAIRQRVRAGFRAAALKPADFFGDDSVLYLMEDMATGNRLSILWEWLHKNAKITEDDPGTGLTAGATFTAELFDACGECESSGRRRTRTCDDSKDSTLRSPRNRQDVCRGTDQASWYIAS